MCRVGHNTIRHPVFEVNNGIVTSMPVLNHNVQSSAQQNQKKKKHKLRFW